MSDQEKTLPEKCCAKCGFLYALNRSGGMIFDPDLLCEPKFFKTNANSDSLEITTQFLGSQGPGMWGNPFRLVCFQNVISPFIKPQDPERMRAAENFLTQSRDVGQNACNEFYSYHPGFSAKEHAEIRLQEQRDAQQQEFQERWNKILHNAEQYWQKKEDNYRQFNVVVILVNLIITIALTLIINFILN